MTRLVPCLVVVLALVAAGCGGDSKADAVAKTYNAFAHDVVMSNFDGACRLMTKEAQSDVVGAGKALTHGVHPCGAALESTMGLLDQGDMEALGRKVDASAVSVKGDSATVKAHGNKASLTSQDGSLAHRAGAVTAAAKAAWSRSFWSAYAPAKRTSASAKRSPRPR